MERIENLTMACLLSLGMSLFTACSSDDSGGVVPNDRKDIELVGATRSAANDLKDFYVGFTGDVAKYVDENPDLSGSFVVSPLSVSMLLSMVANGVEEDVQQEIAGYLGTNDIDALNSLASTLLAELPKVDNQTEVKLANSIWVNNRFKLHDDFSSLLSGGYGAQVNYEDIYGNPAKVAKNIGGWCAKQTNGLIPEMVDGISSDVYAVILNAVYFKGLWKEGTFLEENTKERPFYGTGETKDVKMMHSASAPRSYYKDDYFEMFYLPFGNSAYSLMVVLPNENLSLDKANAMLTPEFVSDFKQKMVRCNLTVELPKFKVNNNLGLNEILQASGLLKVTNDLRLDMFEPAQRGEIRFYQGGAFRIDEKGVKAAAVTSGTIMDEMAPILPEGSYTVTVDHPFYFFLTECSTQACLLSGRITDI